MTPPTHRTIEIPEERNALIEEAATDFEGCTSVGGLAHRLGILRGRTETTPRVFGKFIQFSRRRLGWTVETLAEKAGVDLSELVSIEIDRRFVPHPTTVLALSRTLGYPLEPLMELSGVSREPNEPLNQAALRFAARCEPASQLTTDEREAYDEFVKVLSVSTEGAQVTR